MSKHQLLETLNRTVTPVKVFSTANALLYTLQPEQIFELVMRYPGRFDKDWGGKNRVRYVRDSQSNIPIFFAHHEDCWRTTEAATYYPNAGYYESKHSRPGVSLA